MTSDELLALLEELPLTTRTEAEMQSELEKELENRHVFYEREVRLTTRDRIDFLIGSIGVELKTKGSVPEIVRQLRRYADSARVTELVLYTSDPKLCTMPTVLGGKRVSVAFVGLSF